MEEVKGVIGKVGQFNIHPQPWTPISAVGFDKKHDFLMKFMGAVVKIDSLPPFNKRWPEKQISPDFE